MSYHRVIPRDLFNESMLLKCLGQLSLIIDRGATPSLCLVHEDHGTGFTIEQDESSGNIYCVNVRLYMQRPCCGKHDEVHLYHPLNSRHPYPLCFSCGDTNDRVFTDEGKLHEEFIRFLGEKK